MKIVTYQCPNCNAALEYNNELGKFKCFYCDSEFSDINIQQEFAENEQLKLDKEDPTLTDEQKEIEEFTNTSALYSCPNCGAGVICSDLESSTRCHFCHTPVILTGRLSGAFKPDLIIPFATTREVAEQAFESYTKGKFLLPNGFKQNAKVTKISALYVPYWLKSGIMDVTAEGTATKVKTWRTGDVRHTNTKYYTVRRKAQMPFIRVPCDGSKRIDDALMQSIEPFNYSGIKKFSMSYLSGCAAEKYDLPYADAEPIIDQRIREAALDTVKADIQRGGYTSVNISGVDVRDASSNTSKKVALYALLPVWFLNYQYNGKDYPFVMNGQTGTHFGILPVSKMKKFLFSGGLFSVLTVIGVFLGGVFFG